MEIQELFAATLPRQQALEEAITEVERHFRAGFEFPDFETWLSEQPSRDAA